MKATRDFSRCLADLERLGWLDTLEISPVIAGDVRFLGRFVLPDHGRLERPSYEKALAELSRLAESRANAEVLAARGRVYRILGQPRPARADFEAALKQEPSCAIAEACSAELDLASAPQRSRDLLSRLLERNPGEERLLVWKAYADVLSGDADAGLRLLNGGALDAARFGSGRILRGLLRERSGDSAGAEEDFNALIRRYPGLAGLYTLRASARCKSGKRALAVEDAHTALDLHPENLDAFVRLLYHSRGLAASQDAVLEREVLLEALKGELSSAPTSAWPHAVKAAVLGRSPLQLEPLRRALALGLKRPWVHAFLGRALGDDSVGELKASLKEMNAAARLAPRAGWILSWRAEIQRKLGAPQRALRDLNSGIRLESGYRLAFAWRSMLRETLGDREGAVADMTSCIEVLGRASFHHRRALLEWSLGRVRRPLEDLSFCLARGGLYALAYSGFESFLRSRKIHLPPLVALDGARLESEWASNPQNGLVGAWLGRVRLNSGRVNEAQAALEKARRGEGFPPLARAWLGEACLKNQNTRQALAHLDAAVEVEPGHLLSWLWRAAAHRLRGDKERGFSGVLEACTRFPQETDLIAAWARGSMPELESPGGAMKPRAAVLGAEYDFRRGHFADVLKRLEGLSAQRLGLKGGLLMNSALRESGATARGERGLDAVLKRFGVSALGELENLLSGARISRETRAAACWLLSREFRRRGKLEEAELALKRAQDLAGASLTPSTTSADSPLLSALRSSALRREGRHEQALAAARRGLRLDARSAPAYAALARAFRQSGDAGRALAEIRRARRLSPRDAELAACEADILRSLGRPARALAVLDSALSLDARQAWCLILRGELYREAGRPKRAWRDLRAAVERDFNGFCPLEVLGAEPPEVKVDATLAWAYVWRGGLRRRDQRWEEALGDLDHALGLVPANFWALAWRGELHLAQGRLAPAQRDLRAALELHPDFVEARAWLGRALCASHHCGLAQAEFTRALELDGAFVWAMVGSAACWEKSGASDKAGRLLQRVAVLAPGLVSSLPQKGR